MFICNNHVMTTIEAGYGLIYLTPNQMVDFAGGEAVVRFDMSTLRTSSRDWVDLWVTPYEDNLALPLDDGVDLNGPPRRAVHVRMGWGGHTNFIGEVYRNFAATPLPLVDDVDMEALFAPSAMNREPFELRISRTRVRFGLPNRNGWWLDSSIADLGWTRGVVQLGHHTYIADKGCLRFNEATGRYDDVPTARAPTPGTGTMCGSSRRYHSRSCARTAATWTRRAHRPRRSRARRRPAHTCASGASAWRFR